MEVCHWVALLFIRRGRPIPIMAEEREILIEYLFGFHDKPGGHFLTQQRVVLSSRFRFVVVSHCTNSKLSSISLMHVMHLS